MSGRSSSSTRRDSFIHPRQRVDFLAAIKSSKTYPLFNAERFSGEDADKVSSSKRIGLVTDQLYRIDRWSTYGLRFAILAEALANDGHTVEIFYVNTGQGATDISAAQHYYGEKGVQLTQIKAPAIPVQPGPSGIALEPAYNVYEHLKPLGAEFDIIHAPDCHGLLMFCLQAKLTGIEFQDVLFLVHTQEPTLWKKMINAEPVVDVASLAVMNVERRVVELADMVLSPSQYMLRWMDDHGYKLQPDQSFVIDRADDVHTVQKKMEPGAADSEPVKVQELVYLGPIVSSGGIQIFLDALQLLGSEYQAVNLQEIQVTILGVKRDGYHLKDDICKTEKAIDKRFKVIADKSLDGALEYMTADPSRLAVMPGVSNNCEDLSKLLIANKIPLVLSTMGGSCELIGEAAENVFQVAPLSTELAACIAEVLENKVFATARSPWNIGVPVANQDLIRWHKNFTGGGSSDTNSAGSQSILEHPPLVSVCIAHHNRGELLENAIASIENQTYGNIEIIVVDDGSTDATSLTILEQLEFSKNTRFPIKVIRQPNRYLGAVRNQGISAAHGKYILFMDDDNEAKEYEIETFMRVATHTRAEILTCLSDTFSGDQPNVSKLQPTKAIFHGENLAMAVVRNPYGDSNCFVLKSTVVELGGFSEHFKVGLDDMEFFTRAVLSDKNVMLIPEALYWYRLNEVRMRQGQYNLFAGRWRVAEPFTQGLHPDLANIIHYSMGMGYTHGPWAREGWSLSVNTLEFTRRVVQRFRFLYPLAEYIYRILLRIRTKPWL